MSKISKKVMETVSDEVVGLVPKVYEDGVQPAVKEIGTVLGSSIKALLSPVRGLLWGWEKIEESIIRGVEKRLEHVAEENRKTPEPEIAVPLMNAFVYTAHKETLREMYLNLLANSMDISQEKKIHPAFVEIIKQFSPLDALILKNLYEVGGEEKSFILAMSPSYGSENDIENKTSLDNLSRLGLIKETIKDADIKYIPPTKEEYFITEGYIEVDDHGMDRSTTTITDFGTKFCEMCL